MIDYERSIPEIEDIACEIDGEKEQEMWKRRVKRRRVMGAAE